MDDEAAEGGSGDEGGAAPPGFGGASRVNPASSIDDLRERLRARIEALRAGRGTAAGEGEPGAISKRERRRREKAERREAAAAGKKGKEAAPGVVTGAASGDKKSKKKEKVEGAGAGAATAAASKSAAGKPAATKSAAAPAAKRPRSEAAPAAADDLDFAFGTAALPPPARGGAGAAPSGAAEGEKRGPVGKRARLEAMLRDAERNKRKLDKLEARGEAGTKAALQFDTALRRAEGGKVLDNPTLLAKSLKRLDKSKAKSSAAWAARAEKVSASRSERDATRTDNLKTKKVRAQLAASERAEKEKAAARAAKAAERNGDSAAASSGGAGGGGGGGGGGGSGGARRAGFEGRAGKGFINKK